MNSKAKNFCYMYLFRITVPNMRAILELWQDKQVYCPP